MDPDRPRTQMTPAMAEEQARMQRTAVLASFYRMILHEEGLSDSLVESLVYSWHDDYMGVEDR